MNLVETTTPITVKPVMRHTAAELKIKQSLPLDIKIAMTKSRITDWVDYFGIDGVYVSFSGGKDSTVLLHIARELYPDIKAVFVDTGLEYPEVRQFVKTWDNVEILRPAMSFKDVIVKYGYPFISKEVSKIIYYARQGRQYAMHAIEGKNKYGEYDDFKNRFTRYRELLNADFIISNRCCGVMKQQPLNRTKTANIIGIMAYESEQRESGWLKTGCNDFNDKKPKSKPISFWLEQDIFQYIKILNLPIASVYGELIETDTQANPMLIGCGSKLCFTGCQRTGCIFCGYGAHLDKQNGGESRFIRLKRTHPKQYDFCMRGGEYNAQGIWQPDNCGLGMAHVIDELNRLYSKRLKSGRLKLFIEY